MSTRIPANAVAVGQGLPDVCVRHGEPATQRKKVQLFSKPPAWSYALLPVWIVFLFVVFATRKTVKAPAWPFCDRCRTQRTRMLVAGLVVLAASVGGVFGSIALAEPADPNAGTANADAAVLSFVGVLLSLILFVVGVALAARSGAAAIAAAQVSRDGAWVEIRHPHVEFTAQAARSAGPAGFGGASTGFGGAAPAGVPAQPSGSGPLLGYARMPGYEPPQSRDTPLAGGQASVNNQQPR